jgi:hypothetical protein
VCKEFVVAQVVRSGLDDDEEVELELVIGL